MASYLVLNINQLIGLANGKKTQGYTCTAPSSGYIESEADALTWVTNHNFSLVSVAGYGPMKEYYLTTTDVQQSNYYTPQAQPLGGPYPTAGGEY